MPAAPSAKGAAAAASQPSADRSSSLSGHAAVALDRADSLVDAVEDRVEYYWDYLCDMLEDADLMPRPVIWFSQHVLRRLTVEAPVMILFCFVCVVVHVLQQTVWSNLNRFLAVQDRVDFTNAMQIPSLFTHVIAHDGSLNHIKGNLVHLLLVGPSAEHVYGSPTMLLMIVLVAFTSALAHIALGNANSHQLGASGVVFAVILLNSLVAAAAGTIPLSFLLTAGIYCWDELYLFFSGTDQVSHHAHLTGAIVGTAVAYYMRGGAAKLVSTLDSQKKRRDQQEQQSSAANAKTKTATPLQSWFRNQVASLKSKQQ